MKARQREWLAWSVSTLLAACVFEFFPQIDSAVTLLFYSGSGFPANDSVIVGWIYEGVPVAGRLMFASTLLILIYQGWRKHHGQRGLPKYLWRRTAALFWVMAVGLGLIVHGVLKEQWGRPRPRVTEIFGGPEVFMPALHYGGSCLSNCSFVSGHAATGFVLIALGIFGSYSTRRRWWLIGALCGAIIGALRIAQGAHFLSDIVFGLLAIWATSALTRSVWLRVAARRRRRAQTRSLHGRVL